MPLKPEFVCMLNGHIQFVPQRGHALCELNRAELKVSKTVVTIVCNAAVRVDWIKLAQEEFTGGLL
jgi:hypothetical protein